VDTRPRLLLSIDLEDWHQLVHRRLGLEDWDRPYPQFESHVRALLEVLDELDALATFFLLGMTVANHRELVGEIVSRGHDAASHGYAHARVPGQGRQQFRSDLERSIETIESATGRVPVAYRAPAFSITRATPWAYDVLAELGFRCDSSQYDSPRIADRLRGIPDAPYRLQLQNGSELWEFPVATRGPLPVGGGSYWRILPAATIARGLREFSVLYFHPYEFAREPLRASLPPSPSVRQRLVAGTRSAWRNSGRALVAKRLRTIARSYRLVSYDQAYDDIARRYGESTRALSQEGVLV
jgi:polysaccharide deacetylase family protein (PEP-CTERM system associated)